MMRLRSVLPVFAVLVCVFAGASVSVSQSAPTKASAALEEFRKTFAAAVAAKDRAAVAKLSRFPLAVEVYGSAPTLSERDFLRDKGHFDGWFFGGDAALVKCLRTAPLAYQADAKQFGARLWFLDCNGNEYYFGARDGTWAFAAYQNINE